MRPFRFASDELLVERVRAGSAPAFEALFDRHRQPLLAFCRHMLGSTADAEDAVQHTFMAAYVDLMRSERRIVLRPWLYSIARHRCLSVLRARRERPVAELPEPQVDHLASEFATREELRATLTDIARLPDDQRAALVLTELGDVSHAEIAEILGCRHEKVKALVFQARSTLATGRTARDTPCAEIREQLALGLRRTTLRRHVRDCEGCREYGEQLRLQRRRVRILLPIAPGLGLKRVLLGALGSFGGGGLTGVTAVVGALGVSGLAAASVASVAISGGEEPRAATARPVSDGARPALTAPARDDRARRRVERVAASRPRRTASATEPRRTAPVAAPRRATEVARTAPDALARSQATPSAEAATDEHARPAVSRRPAEPPGHEKRATPPGKPAAPPGKGGNKPAEPPGGGKPAEPPGGGKPAEPPGKPAEPPGKPAEPPGKPAEPPGNGGEGPPADPSAGGPGPHPEPGGPQPGTSPPGPAPPRR